MLAIDVLRHAKLTTPGRIGAQVIVNLSENGVPKESFVKLMDDCMRELAEGLSVFDGPYAMQNLFHNVMRSGSVIAQRLSREYGGEARARGAGTCGACPHADTRNSARARLSARLGQHLRTGCPHAGAHRSP